MGWSKPRRHVRKLLSTATRVAIYRTTFTLPTHELNTESLKTEAKPKELVRVPYGIYKLSLPVLNVCQILEKALR